MASSLENTFLYHWKALGGPVLVPEHRFLVSRLWRFDFALPHLALAFEVEGGQWTKGRHTRGNGFAADCEKYNAAAMLGWSVFRFTNSMVKGPTKHMTPVVQWVKQRTAEYELRRTGRSPASPI